MFTPVVSGFLCNPLFIIPSLYLNYAVFDSYYAYFFGARSQIQNMYLKPSGKEVIVETRDGASKVIRNGIFHDPKRIKSKYENRVDLGYGANHYLFIKGNAQIYDLEILEAVLNNNNIDVNNIAYNYDVTSDFTWEYKDLVEIKKRKRTVKRYYKPTLNVL